MKYSSKITTIIFDMDGVIIDSEPIYFEIEKELFKSLDIPTSNELHYTFVGMAMNKIWEIIKTKYKLSQPIDDLIKTHKNLMIDYFSEVQNLKPIPDIIPFIQTLISNNIKIAVASSSSRKLVDIVLEKLEIKDLFSCIMSGDDVEDGKPAPDIFLNVAKYLKVIPSSCLVIEDSTNGIKAARNAGMKCIGFNNPNSGKQDLSKADIIINKYSELNTGTLHNLIENTH